LREAQTGVAGTYLSATRGGKPEVAFCCQEDGMVGIGCGARSYTRGLHYSSEYAVGATGVRAILQDYVRQPDSVFAEARFGFALDGEEQRRRYLIQSLLQVAGADLEAYRRRFGTEATADFPALTELEAAGLATHDDRALTLTEAGLERSDMIGPWLYSPAVMGRMESYDLH
jgi:oxygen-independent coproporphyrinogen-3 oxidase